MRSFTPIQVAKFMALYILIFIVLVGGDRKTRDFISSDTKRPSLLFCSSFNHKYNFDLLVLF
jgi:hypothetical protein